MNDELKEVSFFTQLLRHTATIFTFSVLAASVACLLFVPDDPDVREAYSLFALVPFGLTFNAIFQITGGSVILAAVATFLFSEHFFYRMRFLLRIVIFLFTVLILFSLFAVVFKWIPVSEPIAWLKFFISTFVCFFISIGLTLVKLKLEGKKYNKLLESYKARHKIKQ